MLDDVRDDFAETLLQVARDPTRLTSPSLEHHPFWPAKIIFNPKTSVNPNPQPRSRDCVAAVPPHRLLLHDELLRLVTATFWFDRADPRTAVVGWFETKVRAQAAKKLRQTEKNLRQAIHTTAWIGAFTCHSPPNTRCRPPRF